MPAWESLISYLSFLRPRDLGHPSLLRQFALLFGLSGPHQWDKLQWLCAGSLQMVSFFVSGLTHKHLSRGRYQKRQEVAHYKLVFPLQVLCGPGSEKRIPILLSRETQETAPSSLLRFLNLPSENKVTWESGCWQSQDRRFLMSELCFLILFVLGIVHYSSLGPYSKSSICLL